MRIHSSLAIVGSAQFGLSSAYDCHVYAIRAPEGIVLIDSGSGLGEEDIAQHLAVDFPELPVQAVLLTHAHMDHSGGAPGLKQRYGCAVVASDQSFHVLETANEEQSGLCRARAAGAYPANLCMTPCAIDATYSDNMQIAIAGLTFEAVHVRGHSRDSFCLLTNLAGRKVCFSGDAVFYGGILGVINSWDSRMQDYWTDLPKLKDRSIDMLLPGHGLFTLRDGQRHIAAGIESLYSGFLPVQVGQGVRIF